MSTFAKLWIMGYIGNKPKFSDKLQDLLASFQVAVNRKAKDDDNEYTDWYDILCENQLADFANRALKKGMLVYIQALPVFGGSINISGDKDNKLRFIADEINIISSPNIIQDLSHD